MKSSSVIRNTGMVFFAAFAFCLAAVLADIRPVHAAVSAYSAIEGENYDDNSSKGVSDSWENGGEIVSLGWINSGDYACYKNVVFGYGISKFTIRYSKKILANVDIRITLDKPDGKYVGDLSLSSRTGSNWTDFVTASAKMKKEISGTHDVYLKFTSIEPREQLLHIDWFKFAPSDSADLSLPPVGYTVSDKDGVKYKVLKGQKTVEIISIPTSMELWYMKNTVTLSSSAGKAVLKVTKVASNAAKNCRKLKVVYIGENVSTVEKNAFAGCTNLNTVIFMGTAAKKNVSPAAFYDIKKKAVIYIPPKTLSAVKKAFQANKKIKAKSFRYKKYAAVG